MATAMTKGATSLPNDERRIPQGWFGLQSTSHRGAKNAVLLGIAHWLEFDLERLALSLAAR